jgi:hypothetical protein
MYYNRKAPLVLTLAVLERKGSIDDRIIACIVYCVLLIDCPYSSVSLVSGTNLISGIFGW